MEANGMLFSGGPVWTGARGAAGSSGPVAVRGDRIVGVGRDAEATRGRGSETRRIDLAGRCLLPGFIDAHTHFLAGGEELAGVQLRDAVTAGEFLRRIGAYARAHPGDWITGGGWDHELWGGALPTRDWIDVVTPHTPVFVSRLDQHMALANGRALELAGITSGTSDPAGGTIVRGPDGSPTGVLKDEAMTLVKRVIPEPTEAALERALDAAVRHAVARGVTMVTDMGTWEGLAAYRRAAERGALPIRACAVVPIATHDRLAAYVGREGWGDDRLWWGGVKGFVDGSLGSSTAWFHEPYADDPSHAGFMVTDADELLGAIVEADAAGLQVIVHAIGDRANEWLLDAFADARRRNGDGDRRFRVEHAQHLTLAAIDRLARDGVIASMQPYHAIDDARWAEKRIGRERVRTTYAFRSLLDAGARLAFGSDWTVAPIDPLLGIYAAVTRRPIGAAAADPWVPEQRITVEEAVKAYTEGAAYATHREDVLGTIAPGKYADLVVLSRDIFAIDPSEIADVKVDMTVVGGEVVYER